LFFPGSFLSFRVGQTMFSPRIVKSSAPCLDV
jgi:hypothetical protein